MNAVATAETPDPDGLAEAVRQLQADIAALRAAQAAHVCVCAHSYCPPAAAPQPYAYPFTVTSEYPVTTIANTSGAAGGAASYIQTLTVPSN